MADVTWQNTDESLVLEKPRRNRLMFAMGGVVLIAAVVFLVVNAMSGSTQLYKTVGEFYAEQGRLAGRDLRVSGWVIGDSIVYTQIDAHNSRLEFDIVDDLNNPTQKLHVVALNEPKPDLLQNEAQALVELLSGAADARAKKRTSRFEQDQVEHLCGILSVAARVGHYVEICAVGDKLECHLVSRRQAKLGRVQQAIAHQFHNPGNRAANLDGIDPHGIDQVVELFGSALVEDPA